MDHKELEVACINAIINEGLNGLITLAEKYDGLNDPEEAIRTLMAYSSDHFNVHISVVLEEIGLHMHSERWEGNLRLSGGNKYDLRLALINGLKAKRDLLQARIPQHTK